jgi:hypothetical protein
MPRIPTRTEPYTSPSRQHRHYKTKRDLILRSLGKASYINGCQFAVTFISARGDIETYGSEICSERLAELFDKTVLEEVATRVKEASERRREEAIRNGDASDGRREASVEGVERESNGKLISVATGAGRRKATKGKGKMADIKPEEGPSEDEGNSSDGEATECADNIEDELEETQHTTHTILRSPSPNPLTRQRTSVLMEAYLNPLQMASAVGFTVEALPETFSQQSFPTEEQPGGRTLFETPIRTSNRQPQRRIFETPDFVHGIDDNERKLNAIIPHSTALPLSQPHQLGSAFVTPGISRSRSNTSVSANLPITTPLLGSGGTPTSSQTRSIAIPPHELLGWYAARFDSLQQHTCKVVVKAWIKVMEPKKQTRYPYNKGNEGKPPWWPSDLRHKEPDHLVKSGKSRTATIDEMIGHS